MKKFMSYQDVLENPDTAYYGKNLIAIDACTPASGLVNVVVIEDNNIKYFVGD